MIHFNPTKCECNIKALFKGNVHKKECLVNKAEFWRIEDSEYFRDIKTALENYELTTKAKKRYIRIGCYKLKDKCCTAEFGPWNDFEHIISFTFDRLE